MLTDDNASVVHLRRGGTSIVLRIDATHLPSVLHWGEDLGDLPGEALTGLLAVLGKPYVDSEVMTQQAVALLPQHASGWIGRPGLVGSREGRAWSTSFDSVEHSVDDFWATVHQVRSDCAVSGTTSRANSMSSPSWSCTPVGSCDFAR